MINVVLYLTNIVLVRSNSSIYDPRVGKIARSLSKNYSLMILGWNREGISSEKISNSTMNLKLFPLKAPFGKASLVLYLPFFWIWIFFKLVAIRPLVVHACDLDTIFPSYLYKTIFKKKLVFDVFDRYAMALIPPKFKLLYNLVNSLEEILCSKSDILIVVAENILETFKKYPKNHIIIRNCPEKYDVERKSKEKILTLVYTGIIVKNRGLERITDAIKNLVDVRLVIAGRNIDQEFLNQILELSNVEYKGIMSHTASLELEANSDVMMILYDLAIPINKVANPNKTFEAMMFGLPVITNVTPTLVNEVGCAIFVDYNDLEEIKSAIIRLRDDDELRKRLGDNGHNAFEQKYNWDVMEKELYKVYERLLK